MSKTNKFQCVYCHEQYVPNGSLLHDCAERQAHLIEIEEARRGSDYYSGAPRALRLGAKVGKPSKSKSERA